MALDPIRFTSSLNILIWLRHIIGNGDSGDSRSFSTMTASVAGYDSYGSKSPVTPSRVPG
jgi:hypothetical protein